MSGVPSPGGLILGVDPTLLKAIITGLSKSASMCNLELSCVGAMSVPSRDPGTITGIIGVHGEVSGFITVNMAEKVAFAAVGGLLQDEYTTITHQIIDGVGEITNMIAGTIKSALLGTPWAFSHVTVPSVIVGRNYQIAYAKGLNYAAALFEHRGGDAVILEERLVLASISLIRL